LLTAEQVGEFCQQLPHYKRSCRIIFVDVPRKPTGKIEKPKLREMYTGRREMFSI
jgi:acyl-CoA synthetase (AMP-forming)/AMP-acid ligase II